MSKSGLRTRASKQSRCLFTGTVRLRSWLRSLSPTCSSSDERRRSAVALTIFTVIFAALEIGSYIQKSATWDEPIHLTAGFAAFAESDFRVDPSHPPFLRLWSAIPLFLSGVIIDTSEIDRTAAAPWLQRSYGFAHEFLYRDHDADRLLYAARFMTLFWGILLGFLLFYWAREWLGFMPAVLVLTFYTIEPNTAAHGRLVTTDMGAACFIFGAVYFLWRTCRQPAWRSITLLTICFALAFVAKFSGVLLVPIVFTLLVVAVIARTPINMKIFAGICLLLAVAVFGTIWAVYDFRYAPSLSPTWFLHAEDLPEARQNTPVLAEAVAWVDHHHLLPNAFTQGFLVSQATARLPAYLDGEVSSTGWLHYFPVAFLVKTPAPLVLLFLAGIAMLARKRRRPELLNTAFVLVPIVVFMGFAIASRINIGVRHILPIFPFVLMIAAAGARDLLSWHRRTGRWIVVTLMAVWFSTFAIVYPDLLTYFSVVAGGPSRGLSYLSDSNIDWGQDLKGLKAWMHERSVTHVNLAYFGTADPDYYGIDCTHLPGAPFFESESIGRPDLPGYVAISATILSGVYLEPQWRLFYEGFLKKDPVTVIGNSIHVYWVEDWPEAQPESDRFPPHADLHERLANELLFGLSWPKHAAVHYYASLEGGQVNGPAIANLGLSLFLSGETAKAIEAFRRAVELEPKDEETRNYLIAAFLKDRRVDEALAEARRAIQFNGDDPTTHDLLGVTLLRLGNRAEAQAAFQRALELSQDHEAARNHLRLLQQARMP